MENEAIAKYERFVAHLDEQMQFTNECEIWRKLPISENRTPALVATRMAMSLVRVPIHLLVDYVRTPSESDFTKFFEEALTHARREYIGGTGLKLLSTSFAMVPCIACEEADIDTIMYVTKRQHLWKYHLKCFRHGFDYLPVLYLLDKNEVHYWKGIDIIGGAIHPLARKFVEQLLVPTAERLVIQDWDQEQLNRNKNRNLDV